ncbi:hypothetical protein MLAC_09520 [Mycobacterium lacus]|uniref:Uncharacterized protein n=1 Tax=Mycobacterium lacus TaxID=169765 RepID=A0A7I7NGV4_9MYCO|nr:hypothetical protein MLAC_09520 [Mycobacterium lacus]
MGAVFVGECHWHPGLAEVPDQVAGEHADQHVGFGALVEAVVNESQAEVVGLDDAKVAFDVAEVLVAFDDRGGVEGNPIRPRCAVSTSGKRSGIRKRLCNNGFTSQDTDRCEL